MGKYFLMSKRFNKRTASDFGLINIIGEPTLALHPDDESCWERRALYDYGWGQENGYCRLPIPCFQELLCIVLESCQEEDIYGAAAIILETHPYELLLECELVCNNLEKQSEFGKLADVFQLHLGINRCEVVGKFIQDVQAEALRWANLANVAKAYATKQKSFWLRWK